MQKWGGGGRSEASGSLEPVAHPREGRSHSESPSFARRLLRSRGNRAALYYELRGVSANYRLSIAVLDTCYGEILNTLPNIFQRYISRPELLKATMKGSPRIDLMLAVSFVSLAWSRYQLRFNT